MTEKEQELFYIGASLFLDLDSDEVDDVLFSAGLSMECNSLEECKQAIRKYRAIYVACHLARQLQPTISQLVLALV